MRRKRRRHKEKESSEQITKARTQAYIGGIQSFFKDNTHFEKGPRLMLNPNMQSLMEDVRQLVKDYASLEKRASEIRQERESSTRYCQHNKVKAAVAQFSRAWDNNSPGALLKKFTIMLATNSKMVCASVLCCL